MTRFRFRPLTTAAFLAATTLAAPQMAHAQYTNPYTGNTFNNPMSSFLDTVIMNNQQTQNLMISQMIARSSLQMSLGRGGLKMSPKQRVEADRFAKYRGTMFSAKHPVMPARLAQKLIPNDAAKSAQLEKAFGALLKVYEIRSQQQKAPANDLARTLAYCIAANYCYATEQDVSAKGLIELRRKIREALSSDAKFRALSDAKKQELSETIIVMTHFAAVGYDQAKEAKDTATMAKFKNLAQINLQSLLGVPIERVKLEPTGLVIASG